MTKPLRDLDTTQRIGQRAVSVMIVDDAVVVRGLMSRWLTEHPDFDVVATARNGRAAIDELDRVSPDIIILDLDMPEMDGLTALPLILKKSPMAAVLISSTLTRRNAEISLRCLTLGATDYLPKPESNREVTTSLPFRQELIQKLEAVASSKGHIPRPRGTLDEVRALRRAVEISMLDGKERITPAQTPKLAPLPAPNRSSDPVQLHNIAQTRNATRLVSTRCLLIGASTGGPRAVAEVLSGLGHIIAQVPVIVVQHMPPIFTSVFADHLRTHTGRPAREPLDGERLLPGTIYVAPGGRHFGLGVSDGNTVVRLDDGPPVNFCRPSVDVAFLDAADIYGASALAVVLTGMGHDGLAGARALSDRGAYVIAQDEATSVVWGMPGCIARAGLAQAVLPLSEIGSSISRLVERGGRP
jgi:two-component system, chemotaxis family, protein-glutamate methylesterase/glutaminase